jgi:RES domain-containing protein
VRIWRISIYGDLSGRGGLLSAGRWNPRGLPIVYAADHPATAMLETLAHVN